MWGVSASSVSAEGVAPAADWSRWERDRRAPQLDSLLAPCRAAPER